MSVFVKLTLSELRLFLREPMSAFFTLAFPTVLIVILGCVPAFREATPELGGMRVIDVYAGITVVLILAMLGLQIAPSVLAFYREQGILRRIATTPVGAPRMLAAQLVMTVAMAVVAATLVLVVAGLAFGVPLPEGFWGFVLAFLLGAAAVFAIGLLVAAVAPSGKAANTIGTLLFFPLMFFAGLWTPREVMPAVIQRIGDFTPLGAVERMMYESALGHGVSALPFLVLVGYVVVFGAAAARMFRWE